MSLNRTSGGIRFGTDGWRDVIADGFTFERVRIVAGAMTRYLMGSGWARRGVAVGYDERFLSDRFAARVAEVAAAQGIPVRLASRPGPTPSLAAYVAGEGLGAGIMVTASHNPPAFNGLKLKPPFGGSAPQEVTAPIEAEANRMLEDGELPPVLPLDEARARGLVQPWDPVGGYVERLLELVDTAAIGRSGLAIAADPMHGAAREALPQALRRAGFREVAVIRGEANPGFGGVNPEPIEPNLGPLMAFMAARPGLAAGVAVDGDGDRIGAVDGRGRFVNAHQIFALLLIHLVQHRGLRGEVVKTVTVSHMIDRLAAQFGLPLVETPVGFKYVAARMLSGDVLIGGEESGGIGVRGHIPERDGTLAALLLGEMMATTGASLADWVDELDRRLGPFRYGRADIPCDERTRERLKGRLAALGPERVAGREVVARKDVDGFKMVLEDGSWVMVRASGTEPMVRVYAESPDEATTARLLEEGRRWVEEAREGS